MKSKKRTKDEVNKNYILTQKTIDKKGLKGVQ